MKVRFLSDPKAALAEYGMNVPDGIDVNVVENTDSTVHITMPKMPHEDTKLNDEQLAGVAGGVGSAVITAYGCNTPGPLNCCSKKNTGPYTC